jgi:lysophospholipase L1-like esterase
MTTTMLVIGDSFAEGRGGDRQPDGSFVGWVPQLADLLGIPAAEVANRGAYNATTQDVVDQQLPEATEGTIPLVGVVVGGNDLVRDWDADRFERNIRRLYAETAAPGRTVFTISYPDIPGRLPGIPEEYRAVLRPRFTAANAHIRATAAQFGVLCYDMAADPHSADGTNWAPDGIHPSAPGHAAVARAFADLLKGKGNS